LDIKGVYNQSLHLTTPSGLLFEWCYGYYNVLYLFIVYSLPCSWQVNSTLGFKKLAELIARYELYVSVNASPEKVKRSYYKHRINQMETIKNMAEKALSFDIIDKNPKGVKKCRL